MDTGNFKSLLSCSFCAELATSPYKLGRCSHIFCDNCVEQLKGGKCPVSNCGVHAPAREIHKDKMLQDLTGNVLGIEKLILEKPVKQKVSIKTSPNADIGRKMPPASSHFPASLKSVKPEKEITIDEGAVASDSDNYLTVTSPSKDTSDTNNNPSISEHFTNSNGKACENSSSRIIESVSSPGNSEMFEDNGTYDTSVKQEPSQSTRHVEVQLSEVDGAVKISMKMDANIFNEVGPSLFSTLNESNLIVKMRR